LAHQFSMHNVSLTQPCLTTPLVYPFSTCSSKLYVQLLPFKLSLWWQKYHALFWTFVWSINKFNYKTYLTQEDQSWPLINPHSFHLYSIHFSYHFFFFLLRYVCQFLNSIISIISQMRITDIDGRSERRSNKASIAVDTWCLWWDFTFLQHNSSHLAHPPHSPTTILSHQHFCATVLCIECFVSPYLVCSHTPSLQCFPISPMMIKILH